MQKVTIVIHTGIPSLHCGGESFRAELIVPRKYLNGDGSINLHDFNRALGTCHGCSIISEAKNV